MQFSLKEHKAEFLLLITSIIWGFAFVGIKFSLNEISPTNLTILRFFIATLGISVFLAFVPKKKLKIEKKDILPMISIGFFGTVCYHLALNFGEQNTTAGISSLIVSSAPIFTAILSFAILKENLSKEKILGIIIAFIGVIIVIIFGSSEKFEIKSFVGAIIILISPIAWAFYTIISKPLLDRYSPEILISYSTIFGTLMLLPLINQSFAQQTLNLSLLTWIAVLFLGIVSLVLASIIWCYALSKKSAVSTSTYIYLIPFFGVLGGVILLEEKITIALIIGGALIIFGIVLNNFRKDKK